MNHVRVFSAGRSAGRRRRGVDRTGAWIIDRNEDVRAAITG
jgi:hypothetical protein